MTSSPSPDLSFLGLLQAVARHSGRKLEDQLRSANLGITDKQAVAILILDKHPGCTQTLLASLMGMDRTSVSDMANRMQRRGLITRTVDEEDTRAWKLDLTEAARKMLPTIRRIDAAVTADILSAPRSKIEGILRGMLR